MGFPILVRRRLYIESGPRSDRQDHQLVFSHHFHIWSVAVMIHCYQWNKHKLCEDDFLFLDYFMSTLLLINWVCPSRGEGSMIPIAMVTVPLFQEVGLSLPFQCHTSMQSTLIGVLSFHVNCLSYLILAWHTGCAVIGQGPLLLTWFNFNPSMDK